MATEETKDKTDFTEDDVLKFIPKWRWLSKSIGGYKLVAMNWVVSLLASLVLWVFVIVTMTSPKRENEAYATSSTYFAHAFNTGKQWITQNFTWLYIGTQDAWLVFLIWLCFSSYGKIKLGKDDEKPKYGDLAWFCMLFCCGIGVGFFVFGVTEPLYYYRQPTTWKSWNYDYNFRKPGFFDDDQRANQAIFVSFFHWGLHGWIPYIVPTILLGLCAHRYNLPMGIRTCFFPLLGNQVFGLIGDLIDALSIAATTFGVCTSLGLGVMQLAAFWDRMAKDFNTDPANPPTPVDAAGQTWIIIVITIAATVSVVLGLDRGLQTASFVAMSFAFMIMLPLLFADNTFYLLNVIVQGVGYYLQNMIQIGFDCEAFQQMGFEFQPSLAAGGKNTMWGSGYESLQGKLGKLNVSAFGTPGAVPYSVKGAGTLEIKTTTADCGVEANPCNAGAILGSVALMSASYLTSVGLGPLDAVRAFTIASQVTKAKANPSYMPEVGALFDLTASTFSIPCGRANNGTHLGAANAAITGAHHSVPLPAGWTWPLCPTTAFDKVGAWGTCSKHFYSCFAQQAYFASTNPQFMDWWTVFYWGWWISWAPFFGVFVGTVSRGRTIRATVLGGFIVPMLMIFTWFGVFGGLAIKMERVAELALGVKADWQHGTVECRDHYDGSGNPTSTEAKALNSIGYKMIACSLPINQFFDVLQPYTKLVPFLMPLSIVALLLWFITSSDSGSYVDDLLASSGLAHPPELQKIYWCWTEGITAIVLLNGGRTAALKALRSASICAGFIETLFICFMCTAIYRLVKFDAKDADIMGAKRFNTQLFDFTTGFQPIKTKYSMQAKSPFGVGTHITCILTNLLFPGVGVFAAGGVMYSACGKVLLAGTMQVLYFAWIICHGTEASTKEMFAIAWTIYLFFALCVMLMRTHMRAKYNIWGSLIEDFFIALTMYPFALAQMQMQAKNDGAEMRDYFADLSELVEYDAAAGLTLKAKTYDVDQDAPAPAVTSTTTSKGEKVESVKGTEMAEPGAGGQKPQV